MKVTECIKNMNLKVKKNVTFLSFLHQFIANLNYEFINNLILYRLLNTWMLMLKVWLFVCDICKDTVLQQKVAVLLLSNVKIFHGMF